VPFVVTTSPLTVPGSCAPGDLAGPAGPRQPVSIPPAGRGGKRRRPEPSPGRARPAAAPLPSLEPRPGSHQSARTTRPLPGRPPDPTSSPRPRAPAGAQLPAQGRSAHPPRPRSATTRPSPRSAPARPPPRPSHPTLCPGGPHPPPSAPGPGARLRVSLPPPPRAPGPAPGASGLTLARGPGRTAPRPRAALRGLPARPRSPRAPGRAWTGLGYVPGVPWGEIGGPDERGRPRAKGIFCRALGWSPEGYLLRARSARGPPSSPPPGGRGGPRRFFLSLAPARRPLQTTPASSGRGPVAAVRGP